MPHLVEESTFPQSPVRVNSHIRAERNAECQDRGPSHQQPDNHQCQGGQPQGLRIPGKVVRVSCAICQSSPDGAEDHRQQDQERTTVLDLPR
jgi:hypothetical protein